MALEQVDRRVGVVEQVELAVGLVEDHATSGGTRSTNAAIVVERQRGARRVVGVADDDQPRGDRDLGGHRVEVVAVAVVERHPIAVAPDAAGRCG